MCRRDSSRRHAEFRSVLDRLLSPATRVGRRVAMTSSEEVDSCVAFQKGRTFMLRDLSMAAGNFWPSRAFNNLWKHMQELRSRPALTAVLSIALMSLSP